MFVLMVALHLCLVALCLPMVRGRVRPNRWYGFRTPETRSNERVWYAANAASGRIMIATTAISGLFTLLAFLLSTTLFAFAASMSFLMVALLIALRLSFDALRRIVRQG